MTSGDPSPPADESPQQLIALGDQARRDERPEAAHNLYERSLKLAREKRDKPATAEALLALADNAMWFFPPGARNGLWLKERRAQQALRLFRKLGDDKGIADALLMLAASDIGPESGPLLEQSLAIYRTQCAKLGRVRYMSRSTGFQSVPGEDRQDGRLARVSWDTNSHFSPAMAKFARIPT